MDSTLIKKHFYLNTQKQEIEQLFVLILSFSR